MPRYDSMQLRPSGGICQCPAVHYSGGHHPSHGHCTGPSPVTRPSLRICQAVDISHRILQGSGRVLRRVRRRPCGVKLPQLRHPRGKSALWKQRCLAADSVVPSRAYTSPFRRTCLMVPPSRDLREVRVPCRVSASARTWVPNTSRGRQHRELPDRHPTCGPSPRSQCTRSFSSLPLAQGCPICSILTFRLPVKDQSPLSAPCRHHTLLSAPCTTPHHLRLSRRRGVTARLGRYLALGDPKLAGRTRCGSADHRITAWRATTTMSISIGSAMG